MAPFRACVLVSLIAPSAGLAQTSSPIDRDRVDRQTPVSSREQARESAPSQSAIEVRAGDESAPAIRNIQFDGSSVPQIVAEAAQDFVGQPATRSTLQALAAAMSQAYQQSEVALFTIAIPEQDLSRGEVRVRVAEGHVEAVILTGEVEGRRLGLVRRYADQLTRERPTSRRRLERYLSLIQDIPGLRVSSQLQIGRNPSGVRVILKLDFVRPTVGFGFDNRSTRLVKGGQFTGAARGFGLLREGDETQLNGTASVDFNDLLFAGISHSTPLGSEGSRLSLSGGFLRTRPEGSARAGEARSAGLVVSHPLIRSYRRNLTLSAALDGIDSEGAAFGSVISTERTRAARLAVAFVQASERRTVSAGVTVSRGLDVLDAEVPATTGVATFLKINGRGALDHTIAARTTLRLQASGQWTHDPLPAVERFSVGGPTFGRGFEVGLINADRGIAGLAEIAWKPIKNGRFARSEIYSFVDAASARLLERPGFLVQDFDLASAGSGVRFVWTDKAMLELEGARTLDKPYPGYDSDWRFSVSWKVSLRP